VWQGKIAKEHSADIAWLPHSTNGSINFSSFGRGSWRKQAWVLKKALKEAGGNQQKHVRRK
jgi:hypothetical protein